MNENIENDSYMENSLENIKKLFSNPFELNLNIVEEDSNFHYVDVFFKTKKEKNTEMTEAQLNKENKDINKNVNILGQKSSEAQILPQKEIILDIKEVSIKNNSTNKKFPETADLPNQKYWKNILNKIEFSNIQENLDNANANVYIGKKRKNNEINHDVFVPDKYIKKIRTITLDSLFNFINTLIIIVFNNNIGQGMCRKQLRKINKQNLEHSPVEYDKEFLNKKLSEIFSSISERYTSLLGNENKKLIEELINLEDKGNYFQELFELSFLDCLEHIRGTKNSELLNDLPKIDDMLKNESQSLKKYDLENIKKYVMYYEKFVKKKNPRKSKKMS